MPPRCLVCAGRDDVVAGVCSSCRSQIQAIPAPSCEVCGKTVGTPGICLECRLEPPAYDRCLSACRFDGLVRDVIHRFKYRKLTVYKKFLAGLICDVISREGISADIVTSVPLHFSGVMRRGYNHAALIAREVSRHEKTGIDHGALVKTRKTQSQVGLSKKEREQNLKNAFIARGVEGKSVMVIDDVITTGRTAQQVSKALKHAGARRVIFVSVGRAVS